MNLFYQLFPFRAFVVEGESMLPTFHPQQKVLVNGWAYRFHKPAMEEIVAVTYKEKVLIKRVQQCTTNGLYVLGDNPQKSTDSRHFGLLPFSALVGKVIYAL